MAKTFCLSSLSLFWRRRRRRRRWWLQWRRWRWRSVRATELGCLERFSSFLFPLLLLFLLLILSQCCCCCFYYLHHKNCQLHNRIQWTSLVSLFLLLRRNNKQNKNNKKNLHNAHQISVSLSLFFPFSRSLIYMDFISRFFLLLVCMSIASLFLSFKLSLLLFHCSPPLSVLFSKINCFLLLSSLLLLFSFFCVYINLT